MGRVSNIKTDVKGQNDQHAHCPKRDCWGPILFLLEETATPWAKIGTHRVGPLNYNFVAVWALVSLGDVEHGAQLLLWIALHLNKR